MPITTGDIQSASTTFYGTSIHIPPNPTDNLIRLPVKVDKTDKHDRNKIPMQYVGRTLPVYDIGEQKTEEISQTAIVTFEMSNYSRIMQWMPYFMKDTILSLCYRDNRGRVIFGTMTEYSETETPYATQIEFTISRSEFSEAI